MLETAVPREIAIPMCVEPLNRATLNGPAGQLARIARYSLFTVGGGQAQTGLRQAGSLVLGSRSDGFDGSRLFVVGGRSGTTVYNDVWVYRFDLSQWQQLSLSTSLAARYDAGLAVKGNTLYVGGGVDANGSYLGDLVRINGLDGTTYSYGGVLPTGGGTATQVQPGGSGPGLLRLAAPPAGIVRDEPGTPRTRPRGRPESVEITPRRTRELSR